MEKIQKRNEMLKNGSVGQGLTTAYQSSLDSNNNASTEHLHKHMYQPSTTIVVSKHVEA